MPGTKRQRRGSIVGKPTVTRRRRGRNALVSVPRNKIGFPQAMRTKLRYSTRVEFSRSGTSALQFQLRGNGLFDPQTAVGGHQPRGFDEFMTTYEMYTVHGSKCSGSFMFEGYNGPTEVSNLGNLTQNILQNTTSSVSGVVLELRDVGPCHVSLLRVSTLPDEPRLVISF